jgi:hypothetical protein
MLVIVDVIDAVLCDECDEMDDDDKDWLVATILFFQFRI